jgi:hypothetical protein
MKKVYETHWGFMDRILTTRKLKLEWKDVFSVIEFLLLSWVGFGLLWFLYKFGLAMSAWNDLHNMMLGY